MGKKYGRKPAKRFQVRFSTPSAVKGVRRRWKEIAEFQEETRKAEETNRRRVPARC
ncbi:hypothetical protein KCP71_12075 [Salmonella enterica subsp. enterica]|nr:hypothetical protein KCP71_12075 [Salmonella enterica subsp. enterica]